ncbi:MAG: (Fe-S)-binding protein [Desulfocapsa sp.]|nr:(Fe-S)-binding protein [Desulfocapsa sp.]
MPKPERSAAIRHIAEGCINCGICVQECAFLQEYGTPQELAAMWLAGTGKNTKTFSFECNLCGLCCGLCPKDLDPSAMFLDMRRELVSRGEGNFRQHKTIRAYEKRGSSSLFSWFHLPENCHTVFFPGCALPGSSPHTLYHLFQLLWELSPALGLVFDCCSKPSHDLGDSSRFHKMFTELCEIFSAHSVTKILVACPNCYRVFKEYGGDLEVKSVYEELAESGRFTGEIGAAVTVHDPCGVRFSENVQQSVRTLLQQQGVTIREMKHNRRTSYCCGEGGSVGFLKSEFADNWTEKRVAEAGGNVIVSYCAGCTHFLGRRVTTVHLLDLLLSPQAVLEGKAKMSRFSFTYWNRYRLKQRLKKELPAAICGTREQLKKYQAG